MAMSHALMLNFRLSGKLSKTSETNFVHKHFRVQIIRKDSKRFVTTKMVYHELTKKATRDESKCETRQSWTIYI